MASSNAATKRVLGFAAYLVAVVAPAIAVSAALPDHASVLKRAVAFAGTTAYAVFALQFVLAARIGWVEKHIDAPDLYRTHRAMAIVGAGLAFAHVGLVGLSKQDWQLVYSPWVSWPIHLGRLAAIALVITIAFSLARRYVPINNADWRFFHSVLAWAVLLSGAGHGFVMGQSVESTMVALLWGGYLALAVGSWRWRQSLRKRALREPGQDRAY